VDSEVNTSGGLVQLRGVRLEEPPEQPAGGGYNSSLSADFITLNTPLAAGQSVNVEFRLGIVRTGAFRFFVNIEAQTGNVVLIDAPVPSRGSRTTGLKKGRAMATAEQAPGAAEAPWSPAAAPRGGYVPWLINTRPPASESTRAAEDEAGEGDESKERESKEAPPAAQPASQTPGTPAPAAAKARRRGGQYPQAVSLKKECARSERGERALLLLRPRCARTCLHPPAPKAPLPSRRGG
jgi:hypothetical protein